MKRKGFVRLAIETGAALVPVFFFNEVETFNQWHDSLPESVMKWLQRFEKRYFNLNLPGVYGKGFLWLMPHRPGLTTVVGSPIEVVMNPSPTPAEVDELHQKYYKALEDLFEEHKLKYIANGENIKLEFE